ncbi:selenide, water dikinase SelD [Tropicibacter naphthalenivorans]|uniref:Selenide, water dikinase n=1 Tax=Tropicibacter naphthalenivorans TaxID=441103 RepID=A0A0P1GJV3_9RHOB|nr:selenide, water dikinase SelD [Tropicibacter naphthalenivorans]CUH82418.1 Selenide, water dikinase [Tropicibacter naphthalenivorans]SMD06330.1 selenophosphate synthase [Tropicibacter naphthalenivorans]
MRSTTLPDTRDLVLIGGGHTHALVLRMWGMKPLPGVRVTVINPGPTAPYSGMLPGHLAGHYTRDALDIDLVKLARFAGARIIDGAASDIDTTAKTVTVPGRPAIAFDIASIDVGINSELPSLPGFSEYGVAAKPLGKFAKSWNDYLMGANADSAAVIGGGVAGVEIALAFAHALPSSANVTLIERGTLLAGLPSRTADRLRATLARENVTIHENTSVTQIRAGQVITDKGVIDAGFICGATGARPHDWIAALDLAQTDGFIDIGPDLRSSHPDIFAVGDCAHMTATPRPKAGVYAVRQAPTLLHNLKVALSEQGRAKSYRPQRDYLKLISLGRKSAMADKFGLTLSGPLLWRWKNHIDQKFMNMFRDLPQMAPSPLPAFHAAGMADAIGPKPMCGGCGSKLGQGALDQTLTCLAPAHRDDILQLPGDDAAYLRVGGARQVISTDHLRSMIEDPVVMTRIAAIHALGDVWAMGAKPQAVTTNIILPRLSKQLAARSFSEIMATAQEVITEAGAQIVGGHTTLGAELTLGFTITGLCDAEPITLAGAQPGDTIILTKPIGSGVVMAAEMAGSAKGDWVMDTLDLMMQPQGRASEILSKANAMTDVTGFGLVGHVNNICKASGVGARLDLDAIPVMPGALELSQDGVRSTLYPDNRQVLPALAEDARIALLFDPQTAGGLLACVSGNPQDLLRQLASAGYTAAIIGEITDKAGQIDVA